MTTQAVIDLQIKQGATFRRSLVWKTRDDAGTATPVPLAGYEARMQIRARKGADTALLTLTSDAESEDYSPHAHLVLEPDDATGRIDIYIGATVTGQLTRSGVYDLELHLLGDPDEVVPFIGGAVLLDKQVTE